MDFLTSTNWKFLEREYFHNYSKDKESSVLLDEIYEDEEFHEDDVNYVAEMVNLANDIWARFGEGWCRSWYALSTKYRPLDNYDG
ncbi:MAG: hypothetical protein MJZ20_09465 [Bacteroidaceae bacterium]|nr:hypothetical protein [Bacteroidaceae bacterium]